LRRDGKPDGGMFLSWDMRNGKFPWIMRPELVIALRMFRTRDRELLYSGEATIEDAPTLSEGAVSQYL